MEATKKAKLIEEGKIYISKNSLELLPLTFCRSGPYAGKRAVIIAFGGSRAKLEVSSNSNYTLLRSEKGFSILNGGRIFLKNVDVIPAPGGAPDQVFIDIDSRCIFNCAFCTKISRKRLKENILLRFITSLIERDLCKSVAVTSGVFPSVKGTVERLCRFISILKNNYPDVPIGVETIVNRKEQIDAIDRVGAEEIKINVQLPRNFFKRLCGYMDYDAILSLLRHAVRTFGEGKVTSNVIYGLGEGEKEIIDTLEELSSIGVVPTLRRIRLNETNRKVIEEKIGNRLPRITYDIILKLANHQKAILEKYGLSTRTFKTMCLPCACCDIVPFIDI